MSEFKKYMPRNAVYEPAGQLIFAETDKGTMRLCDLRGWGHLTGHGQAWGLDANTASDVQDAIGYALAEAWNTRTAQHLTPNEDSLAAIIKTTYKLGGMGAGGAALVNEHEIARTLLRHLKGG